jgi:metal-sulfur cluster biosynthetic enzyme
MTDDAPAPRPEDTALAPPASEDVSHLMEALHDVVDPELGINIVDLGLVYGLTLDPDDTAVLDMTLTSPACPLSDVLEEQIRAVLASLTSGVRINWVWLPPWGLQMITPEGREQMRALGFNV